MQAIELNQRVVLKANSNFRGVVTRTAYEGAAGFVHFDSDEDPNQETYFAADELDPE